MANVVVQPVGPALLAIARNVSEHIYCRIYHQPELEFHCNICNQQMTLEDVQHHTHHGPPFFCDCRAKFWTIMAADRHINQGGCEVCRHQVCICDVYLVPSWLFAED